MIKTKLNKNHQFNLKIVLLMGIISGMVQILAGIIMYICDIYFERWSLAISLFILGLCILIATIVYLKILPKSTYRSLLLTGILVGVCTGLLYLVYNIISISFFYPDFISQAIAASDPADSGKMESLNQNTLVASIALSGFLLLSISGLIISLIAPLISRLYKRSS